MFDVSGSGCCRWYVIDYCRRVWFSFDRRQVYRRLSFATDVCCWCCGSVVNYADVLWSGAGSPSGTSSPPPPPVGNGSSTSPSSSGTTVPPPSITSTLSSSPLVVVVRQFQTVRPYSGKTSWKLFHDHFRRVAKVNSWTTPEEQIQYLMLSLEGAAAEVLKDFDEQKSTAIDDLWQRLAHQFGSVDEVREAMREFDARRQSDTESLVEYEQAL